MIIKLNEIPDSGQDFHYNQSNREMAEALDDLVHGCPFEIRLFILPAGGAYDVRGTLVTQVPEQCSFCAADFKRPVSEKFHEILLVGDKNRCNLKVAEDDLTDPGLNATTLHSHDYRVSDHIHEILAITAPTQPTCKEGCLGLCLRCGADLNEGPCLCGPEVKSEKENAFSVLKNLKLN